MKPKSIPAPWARKLVAVFMLICVSMVGWATKYCDVATGHENNASFGNTDARILLSIEPTGNANEYKLTVKPNTEAGNTSKLDYIYVIAGGNSPYPAEAGVDEGVSSYDELSVTFTNSNASASFTVQWSTPGWTGRWQCQPSDVPLSSLEACGGASAKEDPELSINATAKTLEIDESAETFPIVASKASGSGAVSYESSDAEVATVSNTGLITAVGAGTATITVRVAESDDYAAASKTLKVTVIDWPNIGWLSNSGDSYKLHIQPAIADNFGGKRIDGTNLWVGCPSAEFGACSIDFTHEGAGASFPLTNFTKARNQFTLLCQGTTYTFTVYRKFDGVNLAKNMPSYAGATAFPKAEANDGNKGSRWASGGSAKHYPAYGDLAEDWWYVDLGDFYEISSIKTLFEGATPKNYDFMTSPNADSWIVIDSYNATPKAGNGDGDYNEYNYSPGKVARYVKIFAREAVQDNFAYGISIWEFEVYGQPAEDVDVTAPVLASAAVSGTPTTTEIKIAVSATDAEDGEISLYRVRESSIYLDHNFVAVDGKITIDGLLDNTEYQFAITALDAIGNQSNAIVVEASTAVDPTNPTTTAPAPPARSADDVRAIYSDEYANILNHDFLAGTQWGAAAAVRRVKNGNNYLLYDISSNDNITWGMNDGGDDAIVAKDGYHAVDMTGLDASEMEYLHVDVWSLVALTNINVKINDAVFAHITHDGNGWQFYDLEMAGSEVDFTNIRWLKLDGITGTNRQKAAVDNYYFWKAPSGVKAIVLSTNNALWGSATATVGDDEVTSVATDTEVTFTATPNTGYDFAYWTIGETKIYDNPYVVAITSNTNAVATFEPSRTAYCSEPVTNAQNHTIYLTVKKTNNTNEYMILFEGSANTHITGSHGNIQFRLTHVNGNDGEHHFAQGEWTVDATGFGSIYTTFTAADFRAITITNRYIPLTTSNSAADEFNFPTSDASIIKWGATCTDDEAPVLSAPTVTPLSGTSVRLTLSATDNMAALLTYSVNYKPVDDAGAGTDIEVPGTAGEMTHKNIKGLSAGVRYQFTVTVSDGTNESEPQVCYATPSMPTAPVPAHNEDLVRSIYSDKYQSALAHDFIKNNWSWITYAEQNIGGDHLLVYTSDPSEQAQMPDVAWGTNNDGETAIIAKDGFNDGTNKGLDVREMAYVHFDIWSAIATIYPELYLNDTKLEGFQLDGSGWQSFDLPLSSLTDEQKSNIRWIKFIALRTPNPEEIAIDNVYFWKHGAKSNVDNWATFAAADNVKVPADVTVYKVVYSNDAGEEILTITSAGSVIPANTGVLLKSTAASTTYSFTSATSDEADAAADNFAGNNLVGCAERTDISDIAETNDIFCLRRSELFGMSGFFLYTGQYIPAAKAYIKLPKVAPDPSGAPRRLRMVYDQTTTLDNNFSTQQVTKVFENGQLLIIRDGVRYTVTGLKVE